MLSVLIPIYNINVHPLVAELQAQLEKSKTEYEIILADDASTDKSLRYHNGLLAQQDYVCYMQHDANIGRSATRNELAEFAVYPYLLFMDCDARVKRDSYISDYLNFIEKIKTTETHFAVSGGLDYRNIEPLKNQQLRYKYGVKREVRPAKDRNRHPYHNFTPFNLLISKSVFDECRFDETLTDYGYEDTFFGLDLESHGIPVHHIDNELYHDGLDDNRDFLRKINHSVQNLSKLYAAGRVDDRFRAQSRLVRTWEKIKAKKGGKLLFSTLRFFRKPIIQLILRYNSLKAMDLYKLSLFDDLQTADSQNL